jgi:hypothetical protein
MEQEPPAPEEEVSTVYKSVPVEPATPEEVADMYLYYLQCGGEPVRRLEKRLAGRGIDIGRLIAAVTAAKI